MCLLTRDSRFGHSQFPGLLLFMAALPALACGLGGADGPDSKGGEDSGTPVITEPFSIVEKLVATRWGDTGGLQIDHDYSLAVRDGDEDGRVTRVSFVPGEKYWGALYWQSPRELGIRRKLKVSGVTKIVFWAKGETGREEIEFRVQGEPARDLLRHQETVQLSANWQRYELPLGELNPDGVTALFGIKWKCAAGQNPGGLEFYLDELRCE